jgi:hypothetical protein
VIATDFTWRSQTPDGLPIVIGNLQVGLGNSGVLRIPAGTTIPIVANGFIRIGIVSDFINSTGTIIAEGTSDSPIVFRPLTPSQRWNAIQYETPFSATPSFPSRLVHCIIEGAGTGIVVRRYAQDFLTVSNCTIRQCGTGIFTFEVGFPTIDGCRIENCDTALRVATRAERGFGTHLARLPTIRNCTITNNRLALSIGDNFPYEDLSRWDNANNTFTNNEQNIALMDGVTLGATPSSDILAPDYTWRDTIMGLPVVVSQLVVAGRVIIPAGTTVRSVPSGRRVSSRVSWRFGRPRHCR